MKFYISLFFLIFLIRNAWSGDFELNLARDLMQATAMDVKDMESASSPNSQTRVRDTINGLKEEKVISANSPGLSVGVKQQDWATVNEQRNGLRALPSPSHGLASSDRIMHTSESTLDFYALKQVEQRQRNDALFEQLNEEFRSMLGEDVYAEAVWAYTDLKRLNDWINSTMSQISLFGNQALEGSDALLEAEWLLFGFDSSEVGRSLELAQAEEDKTDYSLSPVNNAMASYPERFGEVDFNSNSKFFLLLHYLTLQNFLYLLLSIAGTVYLIRLFRFLVREL